MILVIDANMVIAALIKEIFKLHSRKGTFN
jgi:hypothetical protein